MKKYLLAIVVIVVGVAGAAAVYKIKPSVMTPAQRLAAADAQRRLDQAQAVEAKASDDATAKPADAAAADKKTEPQPTAKPKEGTPDVSNENVVKVKFTTSKGDFVVEVHRDWAPLGVARFLELVNDKFFNDVRFFRVVTQPRPFVVQFGISGDPTVSRQWISKRIQDDPVKQSNVEGTVTFAMGGPNSRTTQLFINLGDNSNLDNMGFAPIGKIVEGMDVVKSFNSKYQDTPTPQQGYMQSQGNAWLDENFPGLDYIKSTEIVK